MADTSIALTDGSDSQRDSQWRGWKAAAFGSNRFASIYLSFRDNQEWLADLFDSMAFPEYNAFVTYCFDQFDRAAEAGDSGEFDRVKGLILALARKDIEVAYLMEGLPVERRIALIKAATSYYELAKGFYPERIVPAIESAWAAILDYAARFGYTSSVFTVLPPHHLFRDPEQVRPPPRDGFARRMPAVAPPSRRRSRG